MKIWANWQDAIAWLDRNNAGDVWILASDWIAGEVSILKYIDGNLFYYGRRQ